MSLWRRRGLSSRIRTNLIVLEKSLILNVSIILKHRRTTISIRTMALVLIMFSTDRICTKKTRFLERMIIFGRFSKHFLILTNRLWESKWWTKCALFTIFFAIFIRSYDLVVIPCEKRNRAIRFDKSIILIEIIVTCLFLLLISGDI